MLVKDSVLHKEKLCRILDLYKTHQLIAECTYNDDQGLNGMVVVHSPRSIMKYKLLHFSTTVPEFGSFSQVSAITEFKNKEALILSLKDLYSEYINMAEQFKDLGSPFVSEKSSMRLYFYNKLFKNEAIKDLVGLNNVVVLSNYRRRSNE